MDLGERKRRILQAIVDDYISTAEPVGSRTIAKRHELGLSSATIRNEMSDLEELGLLAQPHASAGRIPSQAGYRLYVDSLMRRYRLSIAETDGIKKALEVRIGELDKLIEEVSDIISKLTNYTTIIATPELKSGSISRVELVFIDSHRILLVIVTGTGIVKSKKIRVLSPVVQDIVHNFSSLLNDALVGLTHEKIDATLIKSLAEKMNGNEEILSHVINFIFETIDEIDTSQLYLRGTTNILNFPEFNDIDRAREFMQFLNEKKNLAKLIHQSENDNKIRISIGNENNIEQMKNNSIIISSYSIGDKIVGNIGIVGPIRMDYSKVVSSLEYMTKVINNMLLKEFYDVIN